MTPHLTIAYLTSRKDPKIEWFLESLRSQHFEGVGKIIIVSTHDISDHIQKALQINFSVELKPGEKCNAFLNSVRTKPSVWQGEHRLTTQDYWAKCNALNTALCLAPDGFIAYVDDLSVLMPDWLTNVVQATQWHGVTLGAYKKVKNLVVENGLVKSYAEFPGGRDSRWNWGSDAGSVPCRGEYLFGCSLVLPVDALLAINGWPEALCDSLSFEDVITGICLENAGYKFRYNRNMLTLESEEHHHLDAPVKRTDKGVSPRDKSHAVLNMVRGGMTTFPGHYAGGIRKMREEVLGGKPFPIIQSPANDWFDGQLLSEM